MRINRRSWLLAIMGIASSAVPMVGIRRSASAAEKVLSPIPNEIVSIYGSVSNLSNGEPLSVQRMTSKNQKTEEPASPIAKRNGSSVVETGLHLNPPVVEPIYQK
jgi:hypothetical protein